MKPIDHAEASSHFIEAKAHLEFHDRRLWDLRVKRDRQAHNIPEWEELRNLASAIKEHTLSHLADYLEEFEAKAKSNSRRLRRGVRRRRWIRHRGLYSRRAPLGTSFRSPARSVSSIDVLPIVVSPVPRARSTVVAP